MTDNKLFLGLLTRCKNEFFIKEFCSYYLSQGVDKIYIIDDDSIDKSIYDGLDNEMITIIYEKDIIEKDYASTLYSVIRHEFEWLIYVDVDEFITTKKNVHNTIRDELITTFADYDWVKVPWVMMAYNGLRKNPESVLESIVHRWNHNKKHPHPNKVRKFRCRFNGIETKPIFRCSRFDGIFDHNPKEGHDGVRTASGITGSDAGNNGSFSRLRENGVREGYLLCYHYRLISEENNINKINSSVWYGEYTLEDMRQSDHPDIKDETLRYRSMIKNIDQEVTFLHIGKCGGSFIRESFNELPYVHMGRPLLDDNRYFMISLRNPIERFVSAFYHSLELIKYNTDGRSYDSLYNDKTCPYYGLDNKINPKLKHGTPFKKEYTHQILFFRNPNHLAESLTANNQRIRNKANRLMNNECEHINKGIGYYLHNGEFVEQNHERIILVQDIKNINLKYISILTKKPIIRQGYKRANNKKFNKRLSKLAIKNIINFYAKTDYKALKALLDHNLISQDLYNGYHKYPHIKK